MKRSIGLLSPLVPSAQSAAAGPVDDVNTRLGGGDVRIQCDALVEVLRRPQDVESAAT